MGRLEKQLAGRDKWPYHRHVHVTVETCRWRLSRGVGRTLTVQVFGAMLDVCIGWHLYMHGAHRIPFNRAPCYSWMAGKVWHGTVGKGGRADGKVSRIWRT